MKTQPSFQSIYKSLALLSLWDRKKQKVLYKMSKNAQWNLKFCKCSESCGGATSKPAGGNKTNEDNSNQPTDSSPPEVGYWWYYKCKYQKVCKAFIFFSMCVMK